MIQQFHSSVEIKKKKITNFKGYRHPSIYCSTVYSSQDMKAT